MTQIMFKKNYRLIETLNVLSDSEDSTPDLNFLFNSAESSLGLTILDDLTYSYFILTKIT